MTEHTLTDPAIVARVLETWPDAIVERPGNVLDFLLTPKPGVPIQVRITGPIANGGGQRAASVTADAWRIPIHERTPWPVVEAMIRAAIEHEEGEPDVAIHMTRTIPAAGGGFAVFCRCRWEQTGHATREAARAAGDEHLAVANA